jgi:hypothetical protein
MRRRSLALLVVLLLAGCDLMTAQTTPRPSRLVATPEPGITLEPEASDEAPTVRPDPSAGAADIVDAADSLADLASYRVTVRARGLVPATPAGGTVTMTSTLIQTEDPSAEFAMTGVDGFPGGRLDAIVVGADAWLRTGGGAWKKTPGGAADFDAAFTTLSPIDLAATFEDLSPAFRNVGPERHNGIKTSHLHAEASDPAAEAAGLTAGTADLWVSATKGYLVGLLVDGTWSVDGTPSPTYLRIEVSRVNSSSNKVAPPR